MAYGLVNSRILTNRSDADVAIVAELQRGFNVSGTITRDGAPIAPPLNLTMFIDPANLPRDPNDPDSYYEAVMNVAAALAPYNPPYVVSDRQWVAEHLEKAGLNDGKFIQPNGTNLTAAVNSANTTSMLFSTIPGVQQDVGNGWVIISEPYIGKFNSYYEMRYQIALKAYLALVPSECVYPFTGGNFNIADGQSLMFTFTGPPLIGKGGFWSLTVYGPDQQLIENDLEKYLVGDRSNLTFPDGSPVVPGEDRQFQILLQASDIDPPTNWTAK